MVQIMLPNRDYADTNTGKTSTWVTPDGKYWCDTSDPYDNISGTGTKHCNANKSGNIHSGDTPSSQGNLTITDITFNHEEFKAHLMFKPDGANACYIPLKIVTWGWSGEMTRPKKDTADKWTQILPKPGNDGHDLTSKPTFTLAFCEYPDILTAHDPTYPAEKWK